MLVAPLLVPLIIEEVTDLRAYILNIIYVELTPFVF